MNSKSNIQEEFHTEASANAIEGRYEVRKVRRWVDGKLQTAPIYRLVWIGIDPSGDDLAAGKVHDYPEYTAAVFTMARMVHELVSK